MAHRSRAARVRRGGGRTRRRRLSARRRPHARALAGGARGARRVARAPRRGRPRDDGPPPPDPDQRHARPRAGLRRQLLRALPRQRPARRVSRGTDRDPEEGSGPLGEQGRRHTDANEGVRLRGDVVVRGRHALDGADRRRPAGRPAVSLLGRPAVRRLRDRPSARQGRHGAGLRSGGDRQRAAHRAEAAQPRPRRRRRARALSARRAPRRVAEPPQLRLRLRHHRNPGLSRHRDGAGAARHAEGSRGPRRPDDGRSRGLRDAARYGGARRAAAASIGLLHRDIKPSNCFVHRDGRVLVGDFGLSVAAAGHGAAAGTILGTPGFASPEQLRGDPLDVRSDIYAVGATLFYLLAGRAPFDDRNTTDLLTKIASEPAPSLAVLRPELPRRMTHVVSRCLAKQPQERYADYAALAAALAPLSSARLKHAPIVRRSLAGWIDSNLVAIPTVALVNLLGLLIYSPSHPGGAIAATAIAAGVMTLYYGLLEGHWGASAGKAIFGLRVVDADHVAPGIRRGILRALAFALPLQATLLILRQLVMRWNPEFSPRILDSAA